MPKFSQRTQYGYDIIGKICSNMVLSLVIFVWSHTIVVITV